MGWGGPYWETDLEVVTSAGLYVIWERTGLSGCRGAPGRVRESGPAVLGTDRGDGVSEVIEEEQRVTRVRGLKCPWWEFWAQNIYSTCVLTESLRLPHCVFNRATESPEEPPFRVVQTGRWKEHGPRWWLQRTVGTVCRGAVVKGWIKNFSAILAQEWHSPSQHSGEAAWAAYRICLRVLCWHATSVRLTVALRGGADTGVDSIRAQRRDNTRRKALFHPCASRIYLPLSCAHAWTPSGHGFHCIQCSSYSSSYLCHLS